MSTAGLGDEQPGIKNEQTGAQAETTASVPVVVRPRRIRQVSLASAIVILGLNVYAAVTLSGTTSTGGKLFPADKWAVAGVGLSFAALALRPWRLRVQADTRHIRVRNLIGDVIVPWELVDRVRFNRGALWASLELTNGELLPVLAVQVIDTDEAVTAVRALRRLLDASRGEAASPSRAGTSSAD
ncbi:PH domain-containing protein [Micromonospora aurantiaca (nom. illeg.)]|uniref:PH domain-containing protein n=1 Tax=Micromonospora aurantiaca (nom. illeg.) TaxID=47850 RepID=UPI003F49CD5F